MIILILLILIVAFAVFTILYKPIKENSDIIVKKLGIVKTPTSESSNSIYIQENFYKPLLLKNNRGAL